MHYPEFHEFFIVLLSPIRIEPGYYSTATKEYTYFLTLRKPKIVIKTPNKNTIYFYDYADEIPAYAVRAAPWS